MYECVIADELLCVHCIVQVIGCDIHIHEHTSKDSESAQLTENPMSMSLEILSGNECCLFCWNGEIHTHVHTEGSKNKH